MTLSTTAQRYYHGATQFPGPTRKVYTEENRVEGVIAHSAEGYRAGLDSQLLTAEVSWHFTIYLDGSVAQHYPLDASCWHAGSKASNIRLIGVEHEGRAGEPLTEAQVVSSVALVDWLAQTAGWPDKARGVRLYEHREVNPATVCPSGRIPWHRYSSVAPLPGGEFLPVEDTFTQADAMTLLRFTIGGNGIAPGVTVRPVQPERPNRRAFYVEV